MLASLIVGALAVVSGSAPLAAARPVTADVLPMDTADISSQDHGLIHVPLRQLRSQRQTARAQRAEQRRRRDVDARRQRLCARSGKCGGSSAAAIVTVEEDEKVEVVSTPSKPVFAARRSFTAPVQSVPRPAPDPKPAGGKWEVCISGDQQSFGPMTGRKPEGITVYANGRCKIEEYAGGFDGYWSVDAGDGHEDGFATAVKAMLRDGSARVSTSVGKNNPMNARTNAFMLELRDKSDPLNMDYPRDAALADGGKRMENINKASAMCSRMITVKQC